MKKTKDIQGWFSYPGVFDKLCASVPDDGVFVECGAWLGKSSSYLCDITKGRIKVFIVDHWMGSQNELDKAHSLAKTEDIYKLFMENMGNERKFVPLRMSSALAAPHFDDGSCDVVFIDMGHTYEEVKQDIELWLPKVKPGGIIAGHDYHFSWPGVVRAVNEKFTDIEKLQDCWIKQL